VVEIVSPGDESRDKFDFYFRAGVKEILIVDPGAGTVEWFDRAGSGFRPADGSALLGISAPELRERIDWP
jgi:Uma2 family endonuclease